MRVVNKQLLIYKNLWSLFRETKKKLFILYLITSFFISLLEIVSVILFMNIVSFATTRELPIFLKLSNYLNFDHFLIENLFYLVSFLFLFFLLFLVFLKFIENKISAKIAYGTIYDFNNIIFSQLAHLNFLDHKKININLSVSNLSKVGHITPVIIANLSAISATIIATGIIILLLIIDFYLVLICFGITAIIYFFIIKATKKKLYINSQFISKSINTKMDNLSLLMGSLRNIILDKLQFFFVKSFSDADMKINNASISNAIINFIPSVFIINLVLIIFVAIVVINEFLGFNFVNDIAKYAALAFSAQKLIPLFNKVYIAITRSRSHHYIIQSVLTFIKIIKKNREETVFIKKNQTKKKNCC